MDLALYRFSYETSGVYGTLHKADTNEQICFTLEHSYPGEYSHFAKVPLGIYLCKRGLHLLASSKEPFETFEVLGVEGHSGILFHKGNVEADSSGCILLGMDLGTLALAHSREAFKAFMNVQRGQETFNLEVKE